ncbi:Para-aminobenzoate synthase [Galdieria sulphuraria]|nr:Para-aminobenzoate synthase [Galdieria sulphuraria]
MAKRDIRILIVDNYDSYTYNLLQALAEETLLKPIVIQNDDYLSFESFSCSDFDCVILSPGPGRPENSKDFGLCFQILKEWSLPLLGVCLGFQGLVWTFGGEIEHAPDVWHGRLSRIKHQGVDIFASLPEVFSVVRG